MYICLYVYLGSVWMSNVLLSSKSLRYHSSTYISIINASFMFDKSHQSSKQYTYISETFVSNAQRNIPRVISLSQYLSLNHLTFLQCQKSFIHLFKLCSIFIIFKIPNKFSNTLISMTHILG